MDFNYELEIKLKKDEILETINHYDATLKSMSTIVVSILSLAITVKVPILVLLTYLIILLWGNKVYEWRNLMAQHAAYTITFLENDNSNVHWETINHRVCMKEAKKDDANVNRDQEIILLTMITWIVHIFLYISERASELNYRVSVSNAFKLLRNLRFIDFLMIVLSTVIMLVLYFVFSSKKSVHKMREEWLSAFEKIKAEMSSVSSQPEIL